MADPDEAAAQVAEALRARLVGGEQGWREGDRVPSESRIAFELGVPLGVVRRALAMLADEQWVGPDRGTGRSTVVRRAVHPLPGPLTAERRAQAVELLEARRAIETEAARLAALRRTDEDVEQVNAALARRRELAGAGRREAFVAADGDFHAAVVAAAGNPILEQLWASMGEDSAALLADAHSHHLVSMESDQAHEDLALAVEVRDPELAAVATRRQFAPLERRLRELPPS